MMMMMMIYSSTPSRPELHALPLQPGAPSVSRFDLSKVRLLSHLYNHKYIYTHTYIYSYICMNKLGFKNWSNIQLLFLVQTLKTVGRTAGWGPTPPQKLVRLSFYSQPDVWTFLLFICLNAIICPPQRVIQAMRTRSLVRAHFWFLFRSLTSEHL